MHLMKLMELINADTILETKDSYQIDLFKRNLEDYVNWLRSSDTLTVREHESLSNMLSSPDKENFILALKILKLKKLKTGETEYE